MLIKHPSLLLLPVWQQQCLDGSNFSEILRVRGLVLLVLLILNQKLKHLVIKTKLVQSNVVADLK